MHPPHHHAVSRQSCALKPGGLWLCSRGGRRQHCWVLKPLPPPALSGQPVTPGMDSTACQCSITRLSPCCTEPRPSPQEFTSPGHKSIVQPRSWRNLAAAACDWGTLQAVAQLGWQGSATGPVPELRERVAGELPAPGCRQRRSVCEQPAPHSTAAPRAPQTPKRSSCGDLSHVWGSQGRAGAVLRNHAPVLVEAASLTVITAVSRLGW